MQSMYKLKKLLKLQSLHMSFDVFEKALTKCL